ncbi:hypothetical protein LCGC14_0744800 [marine sediment metagenome]|uniref:Uncharacterized protein n=1 Tax=marine sediment metagenome TaxID=412755 RepID=A0A0F9TCV6_9ZZZZ
MRHYHRLSSNRIIGHKHPGGHLVHQHVKIGLLDYGRTREALERKIARAGAGVRSMRTRTRARRRESRRRFERSEF